MPYIEDEGGKLNNFAIEPKVYQASPPTKTEQRNYIILGIVGFLLVSGLIVVAVYASSAG